MWKDVLSAVFDNRNNAIKNITKGHKQTLLLRAGIDGEIGPFQDFCVLDPSMSQIHIIKDSEGRTPLHLICKYGHIKCLRIALPLPLKHNSVIVSDWLSQSVDTFSLMMRTPKGHTILHYAASGGHLDCVEHLLDYYKHQGTLARHCRLKTKRNKTAAELASWYHYHRVAQVLQARMIPIEVSVINDLLSSLRKEETFKRGTSTHQYTTEREVIVSDFEEGVQLINEKEKQFKLTLDAILERNRQIEIQRLENLHKEHKRVVLGLKAETADYLQSQKKRYRLTRNEREQRIFESHFQNNAMNPLGVVSIAPLHREEEYQNIIEAESAKVQAIHQTLRNQRSAELAKFKYPRLGFSASGEINFGNYGSWGQGVRIISVKESQPAAEAGLKEEDELVSINNEIINSLTDLKNILEKVGVRDLAVTIKRQGEVIALLISPSPATSLMVSRTTRKVPAMTLLWKRLFKSPSKKQTNQLKYELSANYRSYNRPWSEEANIPLQISPRRAAHYKPWQPPG